MSIVRLMVRDVGVAALLLLVPATPAAAQDRPFQTVSFEANEEMPFDTGDLWVTKTGSVQVDPTVSDIGGASLRLDCTEICRLPLEFVEVGSLRGRALRVTVRVKTALREGEGGYRGSAGFKFEVPGHPASSRAVVPARADWTTLIVKSRVPEEARSLVIELRVQGEGAAWFDELTLTGSEWTWLDQAAGYADLLVAPFRGGWTRALRGALTLLFVPALLLTLAFLSSKPERIAGISWPHRWLVMAMLVTVPALSLAVGGVGGWAPWILRIFGLIPQAALGAWAMILGGLFTLLWWRLRDRLDEVQLWRNAGLVLRYFLILIFFIYAWAKFYRTQFAPISYQGLDTRIGDLTPAGLVWSFYGHSYPYVVFVGLGEAIGALLLAYRRTYLVGALILFAVTTNVVMVNYAYDIGVLFGSTVFLLMTVALLGEEVPRLWSALILRKEELSAPIPCRPVFRAPWGVVFSSLVVLGLGALVTHRFQGMVEQHSAQLQTLPFPGVWTVVDSSGTPGWNRLFVERQDVLGIDVGTGIGDTYDRLEAVSFDGSLQTFSMTWADSTDTFAGTYDVRQDTLLLTGTRYGEPLELKLVRRHFSLDPWR